MNFKNAIQKMDSHYREFATEIDGCEFPASDRFRVSAALFDQSHEHARAILILLSNNCTGSALALLRPQFEACLRGMWLHRLASDQQVESFIQDSMNPGASWLVDQIQPLFGDQGTVLAEIKQRTWNSLCGFVHGGINQAVRRITEDHVGAAYTLEDKISAIYFANLFFFLVAVESYYLLGDKEKALMWSRSYEQIEA